MYKKVDSLLNFLFFLKKYIDCLKIILYTLFYRTEEMDRNTNTVDITVIDELSQNYLEMDETGKEKLKEVSEKIFDIWTTVNEVPYGTVNNFEGVRK